MTICASLVGVDESTRKLLLCIPLAHFDFQKGKGWEVKVMKEGEKGWENGME